MMHTVKEDRLALDRTSPCADVGLCSECRCEGVADDPDEEAYSHLHHKSNEEKITETEYHTTTELITSTCLGRNETCWTPACAS